LEYSLEHKIKKAAEFEKSGKTLHAIQVYNSLINENPEFIDSFIKLASLYEKTGQIDSAKDVYKTGLKCNSKNFDLLLSNGQFFIRNKLWVDALDILKNLSPEDEPFVSLLIAYAYFNLEDYDLSKMHLLRFVISDEQSELIYEAYLYLAKIEYVFDRFEDALKYIDKAELLLNDYWELHFVKAKVLYRLKMYSNSAEAIKLALKLNSKEPELHSWAGKIYIKCEEFEKAERHLITFLESQKTVSSETHLALADAFQKQNKYLEAEKFLNAALLLDPQNLDISERKKIISNLINSTTASDV
jgi:tetratricopeptide (TPR) repeat protein